MTMCAIPHEHRSVATDAEWTPIEWSDALELIAEWTPAYLAGYADTGSVGRGLLLSLGDGGFLRTVETGDDLERVLEDIAAGAGVAPPVTRTAL